MRQWNVIKVNSDLKWDICAWVLQLSIAECVQIWADRTKLSANDPSGVDRQRLLEGGTGLVLMTRHQELESCKPMLDK